MKALIFDYNGILVDDLEIHLKAYVNVLKRYGFEVPIKEVRKLLYKGPQSTIESTLGKRKSEFDTAKIAKEKEREYCRLAKEENILYPGLEKNINQLSKHFLLAIVSRSTFYQVERVFPKELLDKFKVCIWEGEIKKPKPDPSSLLLAAKRLGLEAKECAYIGDSPTDMLASRNAGMVAVGISTGNHSMQELRDAGAELVFRDLSDMTRYFLK